MTIHHGPRRAVEVLAAMRSLALALLLCAAWSPLGHAGELNVSPAGDPLIRVDWQGPWSLPPVFRNHCRYDAFSGRFYCENHCGSDYQFYYCSRASFGCCRLGRGYCGWNGALRCAP
jgi:hypothetical protein